MSAAQVDIAVIDYIAASTVSSPPVNAQGRQFHVGMMTTMDELSDRDDVRVVALTGSGKCFFFPADLKAKAERTAASGEAWRHIRHERKCCHSIVECRKSVIVAINGPALGAGPTLAASCDILVA
tara:strand:+ start:826 stop:1200 length:375 start_codon:yes stop_codon:yes gene_type:complete